MRLHNAEAEDLHQKTNSSRRRLRFRYKKKELAEADSQDSDEAKGRSTGNSRSPMSTKEIAYEIAVGAEAIADWNAYTACVLGKADNEADQLSPSMHANSLANRELTAYTKLKRQNTPHISFPARAKGPFCRSSE